MRRTDTRGDMEMIGLGRWDSDARSLFIDSHGRDWHIMIRRCDAKQCECLREWNGRYVTTEAVKMLVPNWETLTWQASGISGFRALCAEDDTYEVRLLIAEGSRLSDRKVLGEFKRVLGGTWHR